MPEIYFFKISGLILEDLCVACVSLDLKSQPQSLVDTFQSLPQTKVPRIL